MAFSHRDHRARRELRRLYVMFGAAVTALAGLAILVPIETVRLLAVAGLAVVGTLYVVSVDRMTSRYRLDLLAVRGGEPISGAVRAEVYHEVGFERDRGDDREPSPSHRSPHVQTRAYPPGSAEGGRPAMPPPRSDPPSGGS
jgi:hypothetical protein